MIDVVALDLLHMICPTHQLEEECRLELLDVATECKSVICCRVSPIQKAEVVKLVKDNKDVCSIANEIEGSSMY